MASGTASLVVANLYRGSVYTGENSLITSMGKGLASLAWNPGNILQNLRPAIRSQITGISKVLRHLPFPHLHEHLYRYGNKAEVPC